MAHQANATGVAVIELFVFALLIDWIFDDY